VELNEAQLEAVRTVEGPLLILAGAGSGKTRTLTERVAHLLAAGYARPSEVLAITFTNKAADEMKARIAARVGAAASSMWVMTFHRASVEILRREAHLLGYPNRFAIYDTQDQLALMRQVVRELNLDEKRYPPQQMLWQVSRRKNDLVAPEEVTGGFFEERLAAIYRRYQERLRAAGAVDFDDLIGLVVELFRRFPDVLERYQERFRYIHVDEYQDTNVAQYHWVRLLAARHRNLAVVGDPDQAIYGWRGADIRNILEFERDFPGARVIVLDRNYRSTRRILAAANHVVRQNRGRVEKELWTDGPEGRPLSLVVTEDDRLEAEEVARLVLAERQAGRRYGDVAVLVRMNAQTRLIEEAFVRRDIPYRLIGGVRFYERAEVKDVLAYLRVMVNPGDRVALERALMTPRRGIGERTLEALAERAQELGLTPYEAIPHYSGRGKEALAAFHELVEALRSSALPLGRMVEELVVRSGLRAMWDELPPVEREARLANVEAFLDKVREAEAEGDDLATLLDRVALLTDADEVKEGGDAVLVMTMHAAKGLEFPVVILPGLEEGTLPHARALYEEDELEEERRLFYVALTRAREVLHLLRAERRMTHGEVEARRPSRFLADIPPSLFAERRADPAPGAALAEVGLGERVVHPVFGPGLVVAKAGEGADAEVQVAFEGKGVKRLVVRYANLRRAGA
jgi:DNA helicase-2/ATP-dependent DNA helicase PcrA